MDTITIQEKTFQQLKKMIITTELTPGQKISESSLIDLLEIGRTPIRESLKQLKKQQLIFTIPQSGTYVSKIDLELAKNARFARECLETEIMVEVSAKLDSSGEKNLNAILSEQKVALKKNNTSLYFDLDNKFHSYCYEFIRKKQIWDWINDFNTHLDRFRYLHLKTNTFDLNRIVGEHESIFNALKRKDTEEVKYLTIKHLHLMLSAQEVVISSFPEYFTDDSINTIKTY